MADWHFFSTQHPFARRALSPKHQVSPRRRRSAANNDNQRQSTRFKTRDTTAPRSKGRVCLHTMPSREEEKRFFIKNS